MHPQIQAIFDTAESRYLQTEELSTLNQYVESLPERLEAYQRLRDQELEIMQHVADKLQVDLPQASQKDLERSLKSALLILRYCAMAMLLNDDTLVRNRLLNWLDKTLKVYNTHEIDIVLYRLLNQRLIQVLPPQQIGLLKPSLMLAESALLSSPAPTA